MAVDVSLITVSPGNILIELTTLNKVLHGIDASYPFATQGAPPSSLSLRCLPTRCCEVAGRGARAPRVGFGPFRSRKPARACLCAASVVPGCRVLHDARMMVLTGLGARTLLVRVALRVRLRRVQLPQARSCVLVLCPLGRA